MYVPVLRAYFNIRKIVSIFPRLMINTAYYKMYVSKMCSYVASLLMELATEAIETALWT